MRLVIHLHARFFVFVERAQQAQVLVRLQTVMLQHFRERQPGFDFFYLHLEKFFRYKSVANLTDVS